jgi:hypothetical protein
VGVVAGGAGCAFGGVCAKALTHTDVIKTDVDASSLARIDIVITPVEGNAELDNTMLSRRRSACNARNCDNACISSMALSIKVHTERKRHCTCVLTATAARYAKRNHYHDRVAGAVLKLPSAELRTERRQ